MHTKSFEISRKETAQLHFDIGEILLDETAVRKRSEAIHKATYLGNLKHQKVVISFNTGSNIYQVYTTIWLTYGNHIFLKDDVRIPVERILAVEF